MAKGKKDDKQRDRMSVVLYALYLIFLALSIFLIGCVIYRQNTFKPNPAISRTIMPDSKKVVTQPQRGLIYDCNGRILAMSSPMYKIHMDCTVKKSYYESLRKKNEGEQKEAQWRAKAKDLASDLSDCLGGKTAVQYYKMIINGRQKGDQYLKLCDPVDYGTLCRIQQMPLFCEGKFTGGLIVERISIRQYPYGKLARRTIGFIRDNRANVGNTHVGLEGKFDYILHGEEGVEWLRRSDYGPIRDYDSLYRMPVDGKDIHTTINIDYQEFCDEALRSLVENEPEIEGAAMALMEVKSGAIRSIVNLTRDHKNKGTFEEISNIIIGRKAEPGSVFKTVTLMTVLNDGKIHALNEKMPTNHGVIKNGGRLPVDKHIVEYEMKNHTNRISVIEGFKMSSNYVFATLALENYVKNPKKFLEYIYSYHLTDRFSFDLDGLQKPDVPTPDTRYWTNSDLGTIAYGYSTGMTPLHILTFYNAIANKGKMMKPYLVEGPSILNTICTSAVADTLNRALKAVTEDGTARCLKGKNIAGKTGTSFGMFSNGKYTNEKEERIYQGTFVGYFPADDPQYSIICTIYSKPTKKSYQGGGIPAKAVGAVVDQLEKTDPYWRKTIEK